MHDLAVMSRPFNFFPALGLESIGDREFLLIAGAVELTFGLLLMSGVFVLLLILPSGFRSISPSLCWGGLRSWAI